MPDPKIQPYGSWKSPITSDLVAAGSNTLGQIILDGEDLYWIEQRPTESGRNVIVRRTSDGVIRDVNSAPFNARTRVHEYGGGAYRVADGTAYFSNYSDQRLYRLNVNQPDAAPEALTPAVDLRYADAVFDRTRNRLIAIREDHTGAPKEAANTIVSLDLRGGDLQTGGTVLVAGNDFYASPRLSPDGKSLAWQTWNHPNMPWNDSELWLGELDAAGKICNPRRIAGGKNESIFQPKWSPDGILHFISDRTGFWNLYRYENGQVRPLCPLDADFGQAQWGFGQRTYAFESPNQILCIYTKHRSHLARLTIDSGKLDEIQTPFTDISGIQVRSHSAFFIAGSPTCPSSLVHLDLQSRETSTVRASTSLNIDERFISIPETIEFPTENGLTAFAYHYPPTNPGFAPPPGEKPPLLVRSHGGPTGRTNDTLRASVQYWTSRGFAVVDVNYGGSTGYGRAYRERLHGQWGVVDVDDCCNAARYLVAQGKADPGRIAIDGGSAGGYTTLCALTFRDVFSAGASLYGIGELEVFTKDTHKFESRYLDKLVGPYPAAKALYYERSPINFVDRLHVPLILFQGLEDKIVPPNQAELMFEAVRKKGLPVAYIAYEGEQHGFRQARNVKRTLDAEFYFFARVFGFSMADPVEPVTIENLA